MDRDSIENEHLGALFRFAWALAGDDSAAVDLAQLVLDDDSLKLVSDEESHATDVVLFTLAYRIFTGGKLLVVPPVHDRVAMRDKLSLQHARDLTSTSLFKSFRGLELPQRAALVLFYTTQCSIHDISVVLHRTDEEAIGIISRGKAEWLHILRRDSLTDGNLREEGTI